MAHDFYRKAQALHEEFQKRELQYLNAERKWNSMISKKDHNLPLQEYLQKINKREKETEETYRNLMKQMEELDKHTDLLSLKLEKLGALRSSISHIGGTPFWPSGLASSNLQIYGYGATSSLNAKQDFSLQELNLKSVSTQTENVIYCENCKSQFFGADKTYQSLGSENVHMSLSSLQSSTGYKEHTMLNQQSFETEHLHASVANLQSGIKDGQQIMFNKPHQSFETKNLQSEVSHKQISDSYGINIDSTELNVSQSVSQYVANPVVSETPVSTNIDKNSLVDYKSTEQTTSVPYGSTLYSDALSQQPESVFQHNLSHDRIQPKKQKSVELESDSNDISRNKDEVRDIQPHFILNENVEKSETKDVEDQSIEVSVTKSDVESMNNEFDFLESETVNLSKKTTTQNKIKNLKPSLNDANTNLRKNSKSVSRQNKQSDLKPKEANDVMNKSSDGHDKSDTSGAPSPSALSANISASDSDSFYGKETPLTATAAYQALFGNIPEKKKSEKYSDSESDEVENALASAIRKNSHVPSKPAPVKKDEKPEPHKVESKPANKASKPSAASKPKSKLTKSTRKVLGLDTSSSSEVELAVKPPVKKTEEDSDEFDFYN